MPPSVVPSLPSATSRAFPGSQSADITSALIMPFSLAPSFTSYPALEFRTRTQFKPFYSLVVATTPWLEISQTPRCIPFLDLSSQYESSLRLQCPLLTVSPSSSFQDCLWRPTWHSCSLYPSEAWATPHPMLASCHSISFPSTLNPIPIASACGRIQDLQADLHQRPLAISRAFTPQSPG
jgi:hypothetical protein